MEESGRSEEPASAMTAQSFRSELYPGPWCLGGFGKESAQVLALESFLVFLSNHSLMSSFSNSLTIF